MAAHSSPPGPDSPSPDTLETLPLRAIEPDPEQPRRFLGDLEGLVASLREVGLIQPIIVERLSETRYRLLAGERRFTAAQRLGWATISAVVRSVSSHRRLEAQILENLHRKDLNPFEEARAYRQLIEEFGLTQEALGKRLGRSQVSISETLSLLRLPASLREDYRTSDRLSRSLLLAIARQPTETHMRMLWDRARHGKLTVRTARATAERPLARASRQSAAVTYRYPIQTAEATVTVTFPRSRASFEEVIQALEEALSAEKARLQGNGG